MQQSRAHRSAPLVDAQGHPGESTCLTATCGSWMAGTVASRPAPAQVPRNAQIRSGVSVNDAEQTSGRTSVTAGTKSVRRHVKWLRSALSLLLCVAHAAGAADIHPLRPPDASSPRATLQGFIETTDDIYRRMTEVLESYGRSDRLYPSAEEHRKQSAALEDALKLGQFFDVSGIAPVLRETVIGERIVQLKEVLDRIEVPAMADIPDRETMVRMASKRWRLPNTEIDFSLVENGPHAGEFLVSAETVNRLPEFYARVKDLPYRTGPAAHLNEAYRAISLGGSATIHDALPEFSHRVELHHPAALDARSAGLGKGPHRRCRHVAMAGSERWPAHRRPRRALQPSRGPSPRRRHRERIGFPLASTAGAAGDHLRGRSLHAVAHHAAAYWRDPARRH